MFKLASPKIILFRNKCINDGKADIFKPTFAQVNPCKGGRPAGWQLFIKNGFTEPFPSLHDMDDWAIKTQLTDIFILNGITPKESEKFVFHKKRHYVNHNMMKGIIQFDLYWVQ